MNRNHSEEKYAFRHFKKYIFCIIFSSEIVLINMREKKGGIQKHNVRVMSKSALGYSTSLTSPSMSHDPVMEYSPLFCVSPNQHPYLSSCFCVFLCQASVVVIFVCRRVFTAPGIICILSLLVLVCFLLHVSLIKSALSSAALRNI